MYQSDVEDMTKMIIEGINDSNQSIKTFNLDWNIKTINGLDYLVPIVKAEFFDYQERGTGEFIKQ